MSRPPPPLNFVRSFECAARHLSFTKAALELGYTQAAISVHIRSLEQYLGSNLFHRHPRSLTLTETGAAFLPTLRQALHMIDQATEAVVIGNQRSTVSIACPMSLAENWLAHKLAGFKAQFPEVDIVVFGTIWESKNTPQADITITMNREDDAPSVSVMILQERLSLLASEGWKMQSTTLDTINELPKIVVLGRQEYWTTIAEEIWQSELDMSGSIRTNATNIALEMAAAGIGATVAPVDLAQTYIDRNILVDLLDRQSVSPWSYYLSVKDGSISHSTRLLRDWIVEASGA